MLAFESFELRRNHWIPLYNLVECPSSFVISIQGCEHIKLGINVETKLGQNLLRTPPCEIGLQGTKPLQSADAKVSLYRRKYRAESFLRLGCPNT